MATTTKLTKKRKASDRVHNQNAKASKVTASVGHKVGFRFFDLPGELRNVVYQVIAETQTATLDGRTFKDDSGLLHRDSPLREEYLPVLLLHAAEIKTFVEDFDFRHIVTFINRLSNAEVTTLAETARPKQRSLNIKLFIYSDAVKNEYLLRRWLNRRRSTTKKGTTLNTSYSLLSWPGQVYRPPGMLVNSSQRMVPPHVSVADWVEKLDNYITTGTGERSRDRSREEAKKIRAVFEELV